ncbi:transglutaminase-like putative cysteine protease [Rheinheimera pacifica]|uniref:transglutaminase family protein n=1 Tax=Rheinheimera pacifica TaxID=173990 RepID=UPI0021676826|nr:transglutaminase family protein [Rheinheimera pacifica]MCS4307267.1 transglutaminase-like putative cysteine protease [Rheinheimera pacifica]
MKYQLIHQTEYRYAQPVANSYNLAWLTPRQLPYQQVEYSSVSVNPAPSLIQQRSDSFGNTQHFIHVQPPHKQLSVTSRSTLQVMPRHNVLKIRDATDSSGLFAHLRQHTDAITLDALLCQHASRMIPLLPAAKSVIMPLMQPGQNILQLAQALNQLIFTEFKYDPEFSTVVTPLSEVLAHKRGVCQDFAQLAISCLRSVGIPARYVSGYLQTRPPEGQPRLVGADASHAWFAVFEPTLGWIDFDPTNNILADEQHLTLAWGRDYADVVPLKGILHGNGGHQLSVAVDVVPLAE